MGVNKYDAADIDQIRNSIQCFWLLKCRHDLKRVKDRKQWQENALMLATQYSRLLLTLSAVFLVLVTTLVITIPAPPLHGGEPHPGHVHNGQIEYVDNVEHYVVLSKLGVEAKEGESVTVYTNNDGVPIACETVADATQRLIKVVILFLSTVYYVLFSIFVSRIFVRRSEHYASFKIFVYEYLAAK